jgi:hypothetical protein
VIDQLTNSGLLVELSGRLLAVAVRDGSMLKGAEGGEVQHGAAEQLIQLGARLSSLCTSLPG